MDKPPTAGFQGFGKIPRLTALKMTITEKIDGTNACVVVDEHGTVSAQSRTRVIVPGDDNYGFAAWVEAHADELRQLGQGYHFGEWYGKGIQRGYGLLDRRFALFNVSRWQHVEARPVCCGVVPRLYDGDFDIRVVHEVSESLKRHGSHVNQEVAAEGVMVYVSHIYAYFKHPFDAAPKRATPEMQP